jgi:pimeloyl-ACP methyl ester carboxylesterase
MLGAGPPVVLVHGLGGSGRWWGRTAPALARSHRVIVPELPGFGYGIGTAQFRLDEAPDLLDALLRRLGVARASLVGHSLGALACAALAARAPERAERLVMIAPPVRTAGRSVLANALPALRTIARLPPAAAATVLSDVVGRSPVALLRAAGELLVIEHAADLARIRAPTLLLWGDRDVLVPVSGARELAERIGGARLRVIRGAGHVPMLDRPDAVVAELTAFLGR